MKSQSGPVQKIPVLCPVCNSKKSTVLYRPWRDISDPKALYGAASGIVGTQTLVTCDDCGMIFESPRYPESVILEGYQSAIEAGHDSQYPMRVDSFYKALVSISSKIPRPGAKILDIGTAGGAFLEAAQRYGFDAYGLEPSKYLVEQGLKRGLKLEQGTVDRHSFEAGSFDMVCLWDVLEHVIDPKAMLREAHRLLKPGGILLVNYPNIGTWHAKLFGKRYWWIHSGHIHHFDPKSMNAIAKATGFRHIHSQRYLQTLELGYLVDISGTYFPLLRRMLEWTVPRFLRGIKVSYYAGQTTFLARREG